MIHPLRPKGDVCLAAGADDKKSREDMYTVNDQNQESRERRQYISSIDHVVEGKEDAASVTPVPLGVAGAHASDRSRGRLERVA